MGVTALLSLSWGGTLGGGLLGPWAAAGALLGFGPLALATAAAAAALLRPLGPAAAAVGGLALGQGELLLGLALGRQGRWGAAADLPGAAAGAGEALLLERPLALLLALLLALYLLYRRCGGAAADPRLALLLALTLALAAAADFLTLYLLLEAANLTLYWLLLGRPGSAAGRRFGGVGGLRRLEPLLAYFLLNLLGSLLLLLGLGLLYAATGAFGLGELALLLAPSGAGVALLAGGLLPLGSLSLLAGLTLKAGLAPFHGWVAPVYEALPLHLFVFLSLFPKGSLLALALRLGAALAWGESAPLVAALLLLGTLNLAVGTLGALHQSSLRRLLVYSGLANLALLLYALALGGAVPAAGGLSYLGLYLATTAALLLPLLAAGPGLGERWTLPELARGVAPPLRATLSLATLNLAGVPPFALFFGKLPVALALAERGWLLPLAALLAAGVVAVAYAFGLLTALWGWGLPAEGVPALPGPRPPAGSAALRSGGGVGGGPLAPLLPLPFLALAGGELLAEGAAAPAAAAAAALPPLATLPLALLLAGVAAEAAGVGGGAATPPTTAAASPGRRLWALPLAALADGGGAPLPLAAAAPPPADYPPLLALAAVAAALVLALAALTRLLGSHPRLASGGRAPSSAYECGFVPYAGLVSGSLFLFFRLAVFFTVFEAELIFLLPWATALLPAAEAGALRPFLAPLAFLVALAYGFGREVRGGALVLLPSGARPLDLWPAFAEGKGEVGSPGTGGPRPPMAPAPAPPSGRRLSGARPLGLGPPPAPPEAGRLSGGLEKGGALSGQRGRRRRWPPPPQSFWAAAAAA